jgi:predicted transposase/invertase (TIGR01784 family)
MSEKPLVSFDYAIKYLLRDKANFSIVEGFISALLQTKGYKPIKILALLESESNREDDKLKRSLADMIVEDTDHNKYIIEIERSFRDNFIHKACFNSSRLIVDNISEGKDFRDIVKIFHISLLYFQIGNKGVIYHGKTIIHDIDTNERLMVHIQNKKTHEFYDAVDILPEYFFISVPMFNDIIEKEIDQFLYVMKHDDVPKDFESPYMKQILNKLKILKMTKEEHDEYLYYKNHVDVDLDTLYTAERIGLEKGMAKGMERGLAKGIEQGLVKGIEQGLEKGMEQGLEKGMEQGLEKGMEQGLEKGKLNEKIEIAKNMIKIGVDINIISNATQLSIDQIKKL